MTTAYKIARQAIRTVEQAEVCRELMREKLAKLQQQPKFRLFDFEDKLKHPYYLMVTSMEVVCDTLLQIVKDIGDWKVGSSTVTHEIDVIHAKYITGVAGADEAAVRKLQALKKRAKTADKASIEMVKAFMTATMLWSVSAKKDIRLQIAAAMTTKRPEDYIEKPEVDVTKDCKKLVAEIKKLNKEVRDVQRGKKTMLDCYKKAQTMKILKPGGKDGVLDILMK